jgi:hypothetical protein
VLLAAAWVLALSGLLAMHALGTHGTHGTAHGSAAPMPQEAALSSPGDMTLGSTSDPAPPAVSTTMTQVGGGLLGLCLAVLGAALALVLLHLRRRPGRTWTLSRPSPMLRPVERERDPPCLLRLSVMRC